MSTNLRNHVSIRVVIELLCKILDENGVCKIKAETFRKAKFDDNTVTPLLWRLLFNILCYSNNSESIIDQMRTEEIVKFVKKKLLEKRYISSEMLNLPSDMNHGSRELLLAFGWLFCKELLVLKLIQARTNIFNDSEENLLNIFNIPEVRLVGEAQKNIIHDKTADSFVKIQQLLILNNKLRLSLCGLFSHQRELYILKHKIYEATMNNNPGTAANHKNHLNVVELQLLKSTEKLKYYLDLLERDNGCLENLLKWKESEEVFWKWMESVLDLKLSHLPDNPEQVELSDEISSMQSVASDQLAKTYRELETMINEYFGMVDRLEKLCLEKPDKIRPEELDMLVKMIEEEIAKYRILLGRGKSSNPKQPTFVLERELQTSRKSHETEESDGSRSKLSKDSKEPSYGRETDIQSETKRLRKQIDDLEASLAKQQKKMQVELENLNSSMEGCYFVPPLRRPSKK